MEIHEFHELVDWHEVVDVLQLHPERSDSRECRIVGAEREQDPALLQVAGDAAPGPHQGGIRRSFPGREHRQHLVARCPARESHCVAARVEVGQAESLL